MIAASLSGTTTAILGATAGMLVFLYCRHATRESEKPRTREEEVMAILVPAAAGVLTGLVTALVAPNILW
ncbi:MAG: hypothetical protein H6838_18225 [Planctomycetes bacterium]|nr:hypothetical protein [Planctomycetota bacterium]